MSETISIPLLKDISPVTNLTSVSNDFGKGFAGWAIQVVCNDQSKVQRLKIELQTSLNGINFRKAAVWDMAAGPQNSGDIVSVFNIPAQHARLYVVEFAGANEALISAWVLGVS